MLWWIHGSRPDMQKGRSDIMKNPKSMSPFQETVYRFCRNKVSLIGLVIIVAIVLIMIFGERISPYSAGVKQNIRMRLQGPSREHLFGTDGYGRDIFTRVIHGTKSTMSVAIPAALLAQMIGTILGACAAFYSRWLDDVLMRILDVFQAIPDTLLALAIVAALGVSLPILALAFVVSRLPGATRSARVVMMSLVGQEHIEAARSYGCRDYQLIFRHIIPRPTHINYNLHNMSVIFVKIFLLLQTRFFISAKSDIIINLFFILP